MAGEITVCVDTLLKPSVSCSESENGRADGSFDGATTGDSGPVGGGEVAGAHCENMNWSSDVKMKNKVGGGAIIECRICQEEGDEKGMEAPCACTGTLKFAHRKCIQKWCNKKGNITCEICNQVFGPHYTATPWKQSSDAIAVDVRQGLGALVGLRDQHFLAMAAAQQDLLHVEYEDYASSNANGIACCRIITLILMLLLLLRHIHFVLRNIEMMQNMSALFNITMEFLGFFLPCYVIARSCCLTASWS